MDILLTWVGARDPSWLNPRTRRTEPGPILSLLQSRRFDTVYLLLNLDSKIDDFRQRATSVLRSCQRYFPSIRVVQKPVDLVSVTDYKEIYYVTNDVCQRIIEEEGRDAREYFVYLSPGTPQMQTVWILLVQSGLLPARMIEATAPDLVAPGAPRCREVNLSIQEFPQVVNPGDTVRMLSVLQAQNDNLMAEKLRVKAEIEALRTRAELPEDTAASGPFRLRDYLLAQERFLYARAMEQAGGNAAAAARLLGIEPAAFRARASALGLRSRQHRARAET